MENIIILKHSLWYFYIVFLNTFFSICFYICLFDISYKLKEYIAESNIFGTYHMSTMTSVAIFF